MAVKSLKRKAELNNYLLVWFLVSALLTGVWLFATPGIPFWPGFAMAGMAIPAIIIGWEAYGPNTDVTEADIDAEIDRIRKRKT